jgi:hypothetical protein
MVAVAVDGEIAAVDGEDFAEVVAFGDAQDGGVGEIHRPVGNAMSHRLESGFPNGAASDFSCSLYFNQPLG